MTLINKLSFGSLLSLFLLLPNQAQSAADFLPGNGQPVKSEWIKAWQSSSSKPTDYVNRLALSDSAYLLQHANNPIDWLPWSDSVFLKAEAENRLIFLSIGYASCHWCHVMESESFMDVEVATILNSSMLSVKVDREQQPDIDAWFTLAVEAINGTSGWPISMILLPDKTPVFAANYLTKAQLITAVSRFETMWRNRPEALKTNGQLLLAEVNNRSQIGTASTLQQTDWADIAQQRIVDEIDTTFGGFGVDRKFPDEIKLQFLLNRYKTSRDEALKQQLLFLLDAIVDRGLHDVVFGGIFRYTTNTQMTKPHFEKMLYNQALTASLFADAANWLDQPDYRSFAQSIIQSTSSSMQLSDGRLAAAIDADHGGVEGGYYLWSPESLVIVPDKVLREPITQQLAFLYGPTDDSDSGWQAQLRQQRKVQPNRIDHNITAWNALWLSALLDNQELDKAARLGEAIWDHSWRTKQLFRMGAVAGFLDDYSYLSNAFWQLYLQTDEKRWQSRARILDSRMLDLFYSQGQLSYQSNQHGQWFEIDSFQDKELPSASAMALQSFQFHQSEPRFVEALQLIKRTFPEVVGSQPEYYLTLIQLNSQSLNSQNFAESQKIFAQGNGKIALRPADVPDNWQIIIDLDEGWHINAAEVFDKRLIATRVMPNDAVTNIIYPNGYLLAAEFSDEDLNVYSQRTALTVEAEENSRPLQLEIRLQACSDKICLLPEQVSLIAW